MRKCYKIINKETGEMCGNKYHFFKGDKRAYICPSCRYNHLPNGKPRYYTMKSNPQVILDLLA